MSHPFNPSTNSYTDNTGRQYQTPDNKPYGSGATVTTYQNGNPVQGTINGGVFVPNK